MPLADTLPASRQQDSFSSFPPPFSQPQPLYSTPDPMSNEGILIDVEDHQEDAATTYFLTPSRYSRQHRFTTPNHAHRGQAMPPTSPSAGPSKKPRTGPRQCIDCQSLQKQVEDLKNDIKSYQSTQARHQKAIRTEQELRRAKSRELQQALAENEQLKIQRGDTKDALEMSRARLARVRRALDEDEAAGVRDAEEEERRMAEVVPSSENEESLSLD